VANFFNLVKLQPYFLGPSSYALGEQSVANVFIESIGYTAQQKALENLDKATVAKARLLVRYLGQSGADGKIQAQMILPYKIHALIDWSAAADILEFMLEKAAENDAPMSDYLSQVVDVQPQPSSRHQHPILFHVQPQYQEKGKDLVSLLS
jgi:hypothetical protein